MIRGHSAVFSNMNHAIQYNTIQGDVDVDVDVDLVSMHCICTSTPDYRPVR